MEHITLENVIDRGLASRGYIKETEVRTLTIEAMPDTGAWTLVINEEIRRNLGLGIRGSSESTPADGKTSTYPMTDPVEIRWKDRSIALPAVVVSEAQDVLLGALVMEGMDMIVDPVRRQLAGAHGDQPLHVLY
jgi:predicted aspartyl protease